MAKKQKFMDITEEGVAAMPVARHHHDVWWDRELQYFGVKKSKLGDHTPDYFIKLTKKQRDALEVAHGKPYTKEFHIGKVPLADARKMAVSMWEQAQAAVISGAAIMGPIPDGKDGIVPEAILADRETVENPNYDALMSILMDAYQQAASGKGADRHGYGLNFEDQDMIAVTDRVGLGFPLGQAIKKLSEGRRLDKASARKEFLGAMVYIAGAILWMDKQ